MKINFTNIKEVDNLIYKYIYYDEKKTNNIILAAHKTNLRSIMKKDSIDYIINKINIKEEIKLEKKTQINKNIIIYLTITIIISLVFHIFHF